MMQKAQYKVVTDRGEYVVYADSAYAAKRHVFALTQGRVPFSAMWATRVA